MHVSERNSHKLRNPIYWKYLFTLTGFREQHSQVVVGIECSKDKVQRSLYTCFLEKYTIEKLVIL